MAGINYPAEGPTVNGTKLTVDSMLKAPTVLTRRIITPAENFLSDVIFRKGTTDSGAILYAKAKLGEAYPERGDVEEIQPGASFPMVDLGEDEQEVALSKVFGAGYSVTDQARRRNSTDVIAKGNLKVRNALLRQDALRCLAAFKEFAPTVAATASWTTPRAWREDVLRGASTIRGTKLGYKPDTVIISPDTATELMLLPELDALLPRENKALNPLFAPGLSGLLQMNWIIQDYMPDEEAILLQTGVTGVNVIEKELSTEVERIAHEKKTLVLTDRWSVPVIDEPHSALRITGIRG